MATRHQGTRPAVWRAPGRQGAHGAKRRRLRRRVPIRAKAGGFQATWEPAEFQRVKRRPRPRTRLNALRASRSPGEVSMCHPGPRARRQREAARAGEVLGARPDPWRSPGTGGGRRKRCRHEYSRDHMNDASCARRFSGWAVDRQHAADRRHPRRRPLTHRHLEMPGHRQPGDLK